MLSKMSSIVDEYSRKPAGSFKFSIPACSLLFIKNLYFGSSRSLATNKFYQ